MILKSNNPVKYIVIYVKMKLSKNANLKIRGLSPFPGAFVEIGGERIKLLGARVLPGEGRPGQIIDGFTIGCGRDLVEITKAQRPGKRPMETDEFLRGFVLPESI